MKKIITKLIGLYLNILAIFFPKKAGEKGFYLFCTPFGAPLKDHQKKFLDTAVQSTLEFEGSNLQVYRWGTGLKVILFLHGWQSHSFRWKSYIEALPKDGYTVYALDAPAHGLSGGNYLNIPMYSRAIEKFIRTIPPVDTAIGHSLGCFALLFTNFRLGVLPMRKMIFMAPPGEATEFFSFYKTTLGLSSRALRAIEKSFIHKIGYEPGFFSSARLAKILQTPGIIIHDELDDEAPYRHALSIHASWENSRLITTTGLGHNLRSPRTLEQVVNYIHLPASGSDEIHPKEISHQSLFA